MQSILVWLVRTLGVHAAAIGGFVAGTYWLLMLVGRLCSSFIAASLGFRFSNLLKKDWLDDAKLQLSLGRKVASA